MPRSSLRPVAITFVLFGGFWGGWAVATADVERSLHFSHGAFGLLLSVSLLGAASANAAVGSLCERWGTGPTLVRSLVVWGGCLLGAAVTRPAAVFAVLVVAVVSGGGAVDVVMNVAAAAELADRPGHLVRFHGLFNGGAAIGALATGMLVHWGISWRCVWVVAGLFALTLAIAFRQSALPAGGPGEARGITHAVRVMRVEGLVLLAIAFAAGAMVEGGVDTWGVLYLREHLASGVLVGTFAAACGYAVAAVARATLGPLAGGVGASQGVGIGAGMASVGLVLLALTHQPLVAGAGLVAAASGISICWPLLLATASRGHRRPGAIVGGMTAMGYLGMVVGPAVVGGVAATLGLRVGLLVLAAGAVFVAIAPSRRSRSAIGSPP